jgi:SAM-dependent methyltransferase
MQNDKMSGDEISDEYRAIHSRFSGSADELAPVIFPSAPQSLNRFVDYAQRLAMRRAFKYLTTRLGNVEWCEVRVLDLGCGRGRWSRQFARLGAHVTGVDISPEAVRLLAREMPSQRFICQDLRQLSLPGENFDVISSVTVMQHLAPEHQVHVFKEVRTRLKAGGYLVILENIADFRAKRVFPHTVAEWVGLAENAGLKHCLLWPANFHVLFQLASWIHKQFRRNSAPARSDASSYWAAPAMWKKILIPALAWASYPIEWLLHNMPIVAGSHGLFIFSNCRKTS